jgi:hypothetical protein
LNTTSASCATQYTNENGQWKIFQRSPKKIIGKRSQPHIILADNLGQVPAIKDALMPYHVEAGQAAEKQLFKDIDTIFDHLPGNEDRGRKKKSSYLDDIRRIISENNWDSLDSEDRELLDKLTPRRTSKSLLPTICRKKLLRLFMSGTETRGTPVYVYMRDGMSEWNGRDLREIRRSCARKSSCPAAKSSRRAARV